MNTTNETVLKIVNVLFWVVFIGLCIKTGALLVSVMVSLFVNEVGAADLYMGLDLSAVLRYDQLQYIAMASMIIVLSALKAYVAYLVVRFFMIFDLSAPFAPNIADLFLRISHVSLGTGILALCAEGYAKVLVNRGVEVSVDWGGGEILFFAGVIYLLSVVFDKGTRLQTESDLTV